MLKFANGPHFARLGLFIGGTLVLVGFQQWVGKVANAQPETIAIDYGLPALPELQPVVTMNGAVVGGEFEVPFAPTPVPSVAPVPSAPLEPTPEPQPVALESGVASTYGEGDGFEGNRTACGQVFRTNVVQVAHKSLPCGTMIRVEDARTGRSVDAEVTDRGPYIPGRIVDLSWGAFRELDATGPGLLRVNVYVLNY